MHAKRLSNMAQELKYYHGEASNPYEEINDQQGAWCMRYNTVASMLWDFEYHWANGWAKYSKLPAPRNQSNYFEQHKQPQKDFANILEALQSFAQSAYSGILRNGSARWLQYLYDNAMQERFYKPVFNVVPADNIPSYLHWYKGEAHNPYTHEPSNSTKGFWWDFEYNWYKSADKLGKQLWEQYLHDYMASRMPDNDTSWERLPKQEQDAQIKTYTKGVARWAL